MIEETKVLKSLLEVKTDIIKKMFTQIPFVVVLFIALTSVFSDFGSFETKSAWISCIFSAILCLFLVISIKALFRLFRFEKQLQIYEKCYYDHRLLREKIGALEKKKAAIKDMEIKTGSYNQFLLDSPELFFKDADDTHGIRIDIITKEMALLYVVSQMKKASEQVEAMRRRGSVVNFRKFSSNYIDFLPNSNEW